MIEQDGHTALVVWIGRIANGDIGAHGALIGSLTLRPRQFPNIGQNCERQNDGYDAKGGCWIDDASQADHHLDDFD